MIKRLLILVLFILFSFGIVSAQEEKQVTLTWDANSEPDLSHYIVYWGTTSGNYTQNSGNIGLVTEYTVSIPNTRDVYYFAVTAVDDSGLESDFSNEVNTERPKAVIIRLKAVVTIEVE